MWCSALPLRTSACTTFDVRDIGYAESSYVQMSMQIISLPLKCGCFFVRLHVHVHVQAWDIIFVIVHVQVQTPSNQNTVEPPIKDTLY